MSKDDDFKGCLSREDIRTRDKTTIEQLRDANDNLFKIARKYCVENKALKGQKWERYGTGIMQTGKVIAYANTPDDAEAIVEAHNGGVK